MGTWGTGISSNDTFADVYSEFFDYYDEGIEVPDITATLISKNSETISDPDDANNFWFALAKAQWECKLLDRKLLKRVVESEMVKTKPKKSIEIITFVKSSWRKFW